MQRRLVKVQVMDLGVGRFCATRVCLGCVTEGNQSQSIQSQEDIEESGQELSRISCIKLLVRAFAERKVWELVSSTC